MFAPAHAGVGDEEDLEFAPPNAGVLRAGAGQRVDEAGGGDLGFGDRPPDGLGAGGGVGGSPADAAQQVLAGEEVAFFQAGVDEVGEAAAQVLGDGGGGGLVEDALELGAGEPPAGDVADDGEDVAVAVADLFVAVALRPGVDAGGSAGGVEVVGDEVSARGAGEVSGGAPAEALDICQFCDTDFVGTDGPGGGHFGTATELAAAVAQTWSAHDDSERFVVCTGGEPLLQLDIDAVEALHERGFRVAIETNGTCTVPPGIDWVCVSPKAGANLVVRSGNELKLVYPQPDFDPAELEALDFEHYFLQPMDGPSAVENTELAVDYCLSHPRWRLSLQTHKFIGIR